jgi:glycine/D-amino acid oxidase-like deaminating enzyme/nitrite reductase/ring-hydroxylating ferredoxin subunit
MALNKTSGATSSIWLKTAEMPGRHPLNADAEAEVCIVGAGIAGLTTAYLLAAAGKSVIVLDDGEIGSGETGRTTAHLVNALDDRYSEIERLHGAEGARLAADSHTKAIDIIEGIVRDERIDCEFERLSGYLFVPPGDDLKVLEEELEAAHRAGLTAVTRVARAPLGSFDTGPCLCFPQQGQFHPMKYLAGVAQAVERRGGRIHSQTHVTDFRGGSQAAVTMANGRTVKARAIVVATNTPVNDRVTIHTKQAAYRTFVVGMPVPRGVVPRALYWDTPDPYHYVRLANGSDGSDVLIVGGEDHKTGQEDDADERFARLVEWTRERFPVVGNVTFSWSGQIMEPVDSLAFIGRNPGDKNIYVVTGDSGNGMTHGTLGGMLVRDLIAGRPNRWSAIYDPSRKAFKEGLHFLKAQSNIAAQYADWFSPGDAAHADAIAPGQGAVLRTGLKKLAVYRDADGVLRACSAVCPHLGCIVDWNDAEKTWDCPCHGSRFDRFGTVLNGPSNSGLPRVEK